MGTIYTVTNWRKVASVVAFVMAIQIISIPVPMVSASTLSTTTVAEDCVKGAGQKVAKIMAGTVLFVFADCLFFGCGFTTAALITAGAASVGVAAATGTLVVKGGMVAATMGCVENVSERK